MPKSNKGGALLPALVAAGVLATSAKAYESSIKSNRSRKLRGGVRIDPHYNVPLEPSPVDQSYTLLPTETTGTFNALGNDAVLTHISPQQADFKDKQIGGRRGRKHRGGVRIDNDYNIPLAPAPTSQSYTLLPAETTGTFNPMGNPANLPSLDPQQADFKDKQIGGRRGRKHRGGVDDGISGAPEAGESTGPVYTDVPVKVEGELPKDSAPVGSQVGGKKKSRKMKKGGEGEEGEEGEMVMPLEMPLEMPLASPLETVMGGKKKRKMRKMKKGGEGEEGEMEAPAEPVKDLAQQLEECMEAKKVLQQRINVLEGIISAPDAAPEAAPEAAPVEPEEPVAAPVASVAPAAGGAKKRRGKKVRGGEYDVYPAFTDSPAATQQSMAYNSYDPLPVGPIDKSVASINESYPYADTVKTAKDVPAYAVAGGAKKSRKHKGGDIDGVFVESNSVKGAEGPKPFPFTDAKADPLYGMPVAGGAKKSRKMKKGGANNSTFGYQERPAAADQSNALTYPGGQIAAVSAVAKVDQGPLTGGAKKSRKMKKGGANELVARGEDAAAADQSNALSLFAGRYVSTAAAGKIPPADASTLLGGAKKSRKMKKGGADERPAIADSLVATGRPADADGRPLVANPPFPLRQFGTDVPTPIGGPSQNIAYDKLYNANASLYTANTSGMAGGNCGCVAGGAPKKMKKTKKH